jgi:predicted lipoprotein with Yx(FWY)xxD motif
LRAHVRRWALAAPIVAIAALTAACGGGSSTSGTGYGGSGGAGSGKSTAAVATVAVAGGKLGPILVDGSGRTLYLFEKDQPRVSACSGACLAAWPVDQTGAAPKAGAGVRAALLGMIKRGDGTTQVTYNNHPLYYYAGDRTAGQVNGEGLASFGAGWYAVSPAGSKVEGSAGSAGTTGTTGSTGTGTAEPYGSG